jgi:Ca2+-binding EF-hand superfamily protein
MHVTDEHFQELLSSKAARERLFDDIAKFPVDGKVKRGNLVTLSKLASYFTDNENSLYKGFHVNVDTLSAAFKYTIEKFRKRQSQKLGKNGKEKKKDLILTKGMVHSFLPTLLLFIRVWDVFAAADKLVVEDQKVFKIEFMRIKEKLNHVHGIVILGETSDEEWEKEFDALDRNHDRYITFEEMCNYALDHIKRPFDYNPSDEDALLEEDEGDEEDSVGEAFVEVVSHSLTKVTADEAAPTAAPAANAEVPAPAAEASAEPQEHAVTEEAAAAAVFDAVEEEAGDGPQSPIMFV